MVSARRATVLLVDDNPRVRSFVRPAIEEAGFDCIEAEDGWTALDMIDDHQPDLIVLDILMPDISGLDVCKEIRQRGYRTPVLFLTVKDRTIDMSIVDSVFGVGGDSFITKRDELKRIEESMGLRPTEMFERKSDMAELIAQIKARLPRPELPIEFDEYLRVDLERRQVFVKRQDEWQEEHLPPREFDVLSAFVKSDGRILGRLELMNIARIDTEGSLQNRIYNLRQALEPDPGDPTYILTVHRIGYRFRGQG